MKNNIISFCLIFFIISLFLINSVYSNEEVKEFGLDGFTQLVTGEMEDWQVPGLAIAIIKDGEVVFLEGFGYRDVEQKLEVTEQTMFAIGSSSKAFTTLSLGMLVDEGKLDLDKPVINYMPSFRLSDSYVTANITTRDLVTHRSGLPRHDAMWLGSPFTREEVFERLKFLEFSKGFRESFQYNNLMYMSAGCLIQEIADKTWEEFVRDRIFTPLEMTSTNFSVEDSMKSSDFSKPYKEIKGETEEIPFYHFNNVGPAGSINSNVLDMAKWVLLHLNNGKVEDNELVSEEILKDIHRPVVMVSSDMGINEVFYTSYALGWFVTSYRGHLCLHHGGNIDGFTAMVSFLPEDDIGVVILTNKDETMLTYVLAFNIYDRLLGLSEMPWSLRFKEKIAAKKAMLDELNFSEKEIQIKGTLPSHNLEDYTGVYENSGYGQLIIDKNQDRLNLAYNNISAPLRHFHYDIFEIYDDILWENTKIKFITGISGKIEEVSISLEETVPPIVFVRKDSE